MLEIVSEIVCTFAAVKQKQLKKSSYGTLSKEEMANVLGGGWALLPDGTRIYWPDGDKIIDGGFYEETFTFLSKILRNKKILGIDIVETNLYIDSSYMTMQLVMKLMLHLLGLIKR